MKVTKKQLELFFIASEKYLEINSGQQNKFIYAIGKMRKKLKSVYESYLDELQEIRIDLASVNDKGNIMMTGNNYDFTPDKLKNLNKKIKDKSSEEIEIEPYYSTFIPKDLSFAFTELFTGFVIEENLKDEQ